jgi:hypothetical protein
MMTNIDVKDLTYLEILRRGLKCQPRKRPLPSQPRKRLQVQDAAAVK